MFERLRLAHSTAGVSGDGTPVFGSSTYTSAWLYTTRVLKMFLGRYLSAMCVELVEWLSYL